MSTQPIVPQPTTAPALTDILNYFNTYATIAAAAIAQEQPLISAGDHVAAVNTAVAAAASAVATAMPTQAANVQAGFELFALGETLVQSIVGLFHRKPKPATTTA